MVALYNSHAKRMTKVVLYNKLVKKLTQRISKSKKHHQSNNKQKEEPPLSGDELKHLVMSKRASGGNTDKNKKNDELLQSFCSQSTSATATTTTTMPDGDSDGNNHKDEDAEEEEEEEMSYIRILPPAQEDIIAKLVFQYYNRNYDEEDTTSSNISSVPPSSSTGVTKCNNTNSTNSSSNITMTKCYMVSIPNNIKDGEEFYVKAGTTRIQLVCPQNRNKCYYNTMIFELVPCTCRDCTASTLSDYNNSKHQRQEQHRRQQHYPNLCHLRVVNDIQFLKFYHDIEHMSQMKTLCWIKGWNSFTNIHVKQIQNILLSNNSNSSSSSSSISYTNSNKEHKYNHINEICLANVPKQYQTITIDFIMKFIIMKSHTNINSYINITIKDTNFQTDTITALSNCIKSLGASIKNQKHNIHVQCDFHN